MKDQNRQKKIKAVLRRWGVIVAFIFICILFSILSDSFLTIRNMINISLNISMIFVVAAGLTCLMAAGQFDISTGWVASLAGIFAAGALKAGLGLTGAVLTGLLIGTAMGSFNAFMVVFFEVPAFIATLASGIIAKGISLVYSKGYTIFQGVGAPFTLIGRGKISVIPIPVVIMIVILLVVHFLLSQTKLGRYFYAVGGNPEAALESGINIRRYRWVAFIICGITAAISGIILTARLGVGEHAAAEGFTMDSFAVFFLGTTIAKEGEIHVLGTFFGALIIGVLKNGLTLLNVPYYYQYIVTGLIIITCVASSLDAVRVRFELNF